MIQIDKEFKDLIPALTKEEYEQLEANILAEGVRDSLLVWNGVLIDGHNRYEIATKHGIPFDVQEKEFADRAEAERWIILNQFGRRNLSAYDRSILALKLKPIVAAQAKENLIKGAEMTNTGLQKSVKAVNTQKEIAKAAGVSHDTIAKVEKIQAKATPEIKKAVKSGEMSINQAYQATRREEKKAEVKKRIDDYAKVQTGVINIVAPQKKYNIIYADPPWKHDAWGAGNKAPNLHYPTMTTEEISALPISELADNDCALFLWATYPHLPEALQVIKAWGFDYSTAAFVWVKKNKTADTPFFGCGAWTRANSEICLLATRGHVQRLDASISQIIQAPIEEHSKKPDIVRELIERLVGKLPRIELFCRHPAVGWDIWGNEA
jgi:N6-adenosine-specific RNA methylase IME4/ParB-like chromosome segregation protein Spo0J